MQENCCLSKNVHNSALLSTIVPEISDKTGKIAILGTFICLGTTSISGHFSIPKIGLRTKIDFFHVWSSVPMGTRTSYKQLWELGRGEADFPIGRHI